MLIKPWHITVTINSTVTGETALPSTTMAS